MVGAWTSDDLAGVLTRFASAVTTLVPRPLQRLRRWYDPRQPAAERNDPAGVRENISRHYDLSSEFFARFLDETMTYSSALFEPGEELADAQRRKIDRILDLAGVTAGTTVLEFGTGWGSLAIRAAQRGARVTTLTVSAEQQRLAVQRAAAAGVADRVAVQLRDYREAQGRYDAVVSVEMIEAVGERYWPDFVRALDRVLAPGGRVALQTITIAHDRLLATRRLHVDTQIHLPRRNCPIVGSHRRGTARTHDSADRRSVRLRRALCDHAEAVAAAFPVEWDEISRLGFDSVFRRMWEFYLGYCEAGFRAGCLSVSQLALARESRT